MREGASGRGARVVVHVDPLTSTTPYLNSTSLAPLLRLYRLPFHYRRPQPLLGFTPRHDHHPQAGEARGKVRGTVKLYPNTREKVEHSTHHGLQGPESGVQLRSTITGHTAPASAHMDTLIDPEINPTNTDDGAQRYASHLRPPCPTRCPPHIPSSCCLNTHHVHVHVHVGLPLKPTTFAAAPEQRLRTVALRVCRVSKHVWIALP